MSTRLFVGGLPYSLTDEKLEEHFSRVGKVISAKVITDKFTGQGKGFGFVEMSTEEEAQKAIQELNNTMLDGRNIVVNEARPQRDMSGGNRGRSY